MKYLLLFPSRCSLHSGGFSSPIVAQKGRDLALVEIDVETVDRWTRASIKHLHQVLNLNPHHQAHWVGLKELTCMDRRAWSQWVKNKIGGNTPMLIKYDDMTTESLSD